MSQAGRDWLAVSITIITILILGSFGQTAKFARGLAVLIILVLVLRADALTRLTNFVASLGGK